MSLKVNYLGMEMKTPFLVGSGPWLGEGSRIKKMIKDLSKHWGGVVTKTYLREPRLWLSPHLWGTPEYRGVGMQNAGPNLTDPNPEEMKGLAESCKRAHDEGLVIIGSIMGRWLSEWAELTNEVQEAGVDAVELNLSCPARVGDMEEHGIGYHIGQKPELAAEATQMAKKAASVPVIPKLTPDVPSIVEIAGACKEGGADGLSAINTVPGIIGIDVETGVPFSRDIANRAYVSGLSGPMIRPIGLRIVSEICSSDANLPVMGIGGVDGWKSAAEYIMVGATAVQICTAFMWKGYKLGKRMCEGLRDFMERKGYESVNDFRGMSLEYMTTSLEKAKVRAVVDDEKCNGCGVCVPACGDSSYGAISLRDKIAIVDENRCVGCGLCKLVCPKDAVTYTQV